MAQKTEKLSQEAVDKLGLGQLKLNESILNIGQIQLRIRELNSEIERLNLLKTENESKFDNANAEFNKILSDLEINYPNGEIDLQAGTVTYQSAE
jgi:hypothetical protein